MRIRTCPSTKKSKRVCLINTQRELGQSPKGAIRHSKSVEWYSWVVIVLSCSGAFWIHFLGFLELVLALRRVFNRYSKIFISFLDNLDIFSNNYLVDKYSKINFVKVQIIHNFIVIQLSPLFPCKQSYFRH